MEDEGQTASVVVSVVGTATDAGTTKRSYRKKTMSEDIFGLCTKDCGVRASVSIRVAAKVSEAVWWGTDKWDKIPLSVEVTADVQLACDQHPEKIQEAQDIAKAMALDAVHSVSQEALAVHVENIRENLFPGRFT